MIDTFAVVSGGSPDYLIDVVADGLVRFLGREKVYVSYSWHSKPYIPRSRLPNLYAITTAQSNSISLMECQALVASFRVPIEKIREYKEKVGGVVAVVDGDDSGELKADYLKIADVYFKREYFKSGKYPVEMLTKISRALPRGGRLVPHYYKRYPDKVFNLPLGVIPFDYGLGNSGLEKTGNLFFAGNDTSEIRKQLKEAIIKRESDGYSYMPNALNMSDYAAEISKHWICVAPRGSGWDTYRYWEIPYIASVLLCQESPLKIDYDFVHEESCLRFSNVNEAMCLVEEYLKKKDKLSNIAAKGNELVMKNHLSIHRANRVWKAVNDIKRSS